MLVHDSLRWLQAGQEGSTEGSSAEEEANVWAHCQVMWGNLLYELSQMKAAVGEEWKPMLDEATAKFRSAGCPEADIRQALSGHTMKEHIDLGPEPEPEKVWALTKHSTRHPVSACLVV